MTGSALVAGTTSWSHRLVLVRDEVALARAAHRAEPLARDVLEGGAGRDAAVGVAVLGVVDEPAGLADERWVVGSLIARSVRAAAVRRRDSGAGDRPTARSGEELNTGAATVPRQAATVILLRGGGRRSRCCSSSAIRQRASWAACGSSPAARSTRTGEGDEAHRPAAVRELARGGGRRRSWTPRAREVLALDHAGGGRVRFDTHFFLAPAARRRRAAPSTATSASTSVGSRPPGALDAHRERQDPRSCSRRSSTSSSSRVLQRRRAARYARGPRGAARRAEGRHQRRDGARAAAGRARLRRMRGPRGIK